MVRVICVSDSAVLAEHQAVDVREYPEVAAGAIRGSRHVPLASLAQAAAAWDRNQPLLLVCKSGKRATRGAETLTGLGFTRLAVLEGGMDAWCAAGLPVDMAQRKPWSLERQVRTIAGALVLGFTLLGYYVSPWFLAAAGVVGAGLLFAGLTDTCLMASLLGRMPWNRPTCRN
jgi:rhodanese-related sulfurtransferase